MTWLFGLLLLLLMGVVAVVAVGRGGGLRPAYDDRPDVELPADRPVRGADLRALRLSTALRGYRMSEVDALLELLADQLDAQERRPDA